MIMVDGFEYPIPNQTLEVFDWVDEIAITSRYEFDITKFDNSIKLCEEVVKCMAIMIVQCEYPCDGIVIRIEDAVIKSLLGRNEEDCINNFERAYKFPPATAKTVIESIQQEIGLLGKVSFTAKVKPVKINNKTKSSYLLKNIMLVGNNGLSSKKLKYKKNSNQGRNLYPGPHHRPSEYPPYGEPLQGPLLRSV